MSNDLIHLLPVNTEEARLLSANEIEVLDFLFPEAPAAMAMAMATTTTAPAAMEEEEAPAASDKQKILCINISIVVVLLMVLLLYDLLPVVQTLFSSCCNVGALQFKSILIALCCTILVVNLINFQR